VALERSSTSRSHMLRGVGVGGLGIRATSYDPTKPLLHVRLKSDRRIWRMLLLKTSLIEGHLKKVDDSKAEEPSS
jgi:hypothetical protein